MNRNLFLKRAIGRAARFAPKERPRRVVLLYHSVGRSPWSLPEDRFRAQVDWLSAHAELASVDEVLAGTSEAPLQVAITFDDGYSSLREVAMPILAAAGAKPCVYLNTGWVLPDARRASDASLGHYPEEAFLSWADVNVLAAQGWTIASHGVDHHDLTAQPEATIREQLVASKARIETELGVPCVHFAYTWGRSTARVRELVSEAGYRYAMGTVHGPVRAADDPRALPRINIANDYTLDDFGAILRGDWDYLGRIQTLRAERTQ